MEALDRKPRGSSPAWYWIVATQDPRTIEPVLDCLRTLAVPALLHHASDRAIRDELLEEHEEGLLADRAMSKAYLAVLLATYGPPDLLPEIEAWVRRVGDAGSTDCQVAVRFLNELDR